MRPHSSPVLPSHSFKDKPMGGLRRLTLRKAILATGGLLFVYIVLSTAFGPGINEVKLAHPPEEKKLHNNLSKEPDAQEQDIPKIQLKQPPAIQLDPVDDKQHPWPKVESGSDASDSDVDKKVGSVQGEGDGEPEEMVEDIALINAIKARKASPITYTQMLSATRRERDYAIALLVREADLALRSTDVYSVTNKNQTAPSGNIHDYLSLSKYYWPNKNTPDGLPYTRIDGHVNPEIETVRDYRLLRTMIREVHVMGMAYHFTGNKDYATKCAMRLREWFLDEATYMNPNINFGSLRKGEDLGARTGVLDMFTIFRVFDALHYLKQEPSWPQDLVPQLQDWFTRYLHWLETSKLAKVERESNNNHGTYFDVQIIAIYLFLGRTEDAKQVALKALHLRIDPQISAKGEQPEEMERKTSWYYSVFNLQALMTLARWGDDLGVDMWNYEGPKGQSIKKAIDFMLPFASRGGEGWPVENLKGFDMTDYLKCLQIAWYIYGDDKYLDTIAYLGPRVQQDMDDGKIKTISTFMCDISTLLKATARGGQGFIWHWCLT
ncbi:hypothetical protein CPC16_001914 [Podila verticillata]|nr:hypothetical protein CPC16_001914 [Podila verticillata]